MNRILGLLVLAAGCYSPNIPNGQLKCSVNGNKCPAGFHCATDGKCWKDGSDPAAPMPDLSEMAVVDMAQAPNPDLGPVPIMPRAGSSIMTGGVTAKSENYKIIMSTGQPPGGNAVGASATQKKRGGVAGTTQPK
jgi:hypothetical protein